MAVACVDRVAAVRNSVEQVVVEYFDDRSTGNVWHPGDFAIFVVDSVGVDDDDTYTRMCSVLARRIACLLQDGAAPAQIVQSLATTIMAFSAPRVQ